MIHFNSLEEVKAVCDVYPKNRIIPRHLLKVTDIKTGKLHKKPHLFVFGQEIHVLRLPNGSRIMLKFDPAADDNKAVAIVIKQDKSEPSELSFKKYKPSSSRVRKNPLRKFTFHFCPYSKDAVLLINGQIIKTIEELNKCIGEFLAMDKTSEGKLS